MKKKKIIYTSIFGFMIISIFTCYKILAKKNLTLLLNFVFKMFHLWFIYFMLPIALTMLIGYGFLSNFVLIQPIMSIILILMLYMLGCMITNKLLIWRENNI